jgi:hypothetical protein
LSNDDDSLLAGGLRFNTHPLETYGGNQDKTPDNYDISPDGHTLTLTGNTWKQVDLSYNITTDTILEFNFRSTSPGEAHAIGSITTPKPVTMSIAFTSYTAAKPSRTIGSRNLPMAAEASGNRFGFPWDNFLRVMLLIWCSSTTMMWLIPMPTVNLPISASMKIPNS